MTEIAQGPAPDASESALSPADKARRRWLILLSIAAGAAASAIVSIPLLGFLIAPVFRRQPSVWRAVGPVAKFTVGDTVEVVFEDSSSLAWGGPASRVAAWLRRDTESQFTAFAADCTHLGCPVRWEASAELFMCPCHGGVYYKNGEVAAGPPPHALQQFPVRISGGVVEVEWCKLAPVPKIGANQQPRDGTIPV